MVSGKGDPQVTKWRSKTESLIQRKPEIKPRRKSTLAVTEAKNYFTPLRMVEMDASESRKAESDDLSSQEQQHLPQLRSVGRLQQFIHF
jgi:hypothetical protein